MRQDHVQTPLLKNRAPRRSGRGAARRRQYPQSALSDQSVQPLEVIDEAFAGFTRVDEAQSVVAPEIIDTLSTQLRTLDKQREQLARLLQTVDGLARVTS